MKKLKPSKHALENAAPAYLEKTLGSRVFDVFNILLLVGVALSCLMPLWYTFCVSISDKSMVAAGLVNIWPREVTLQSYRQIMADMKFLVAAKNSVVRVVLGTGVTMVCVLMMAYPLSKSKKVFPARNILMWVMIFCLLFQGGLVPWFINMKNLHLTNNVWGLVLGGGLPIFNVILVMNFYRNLPKEMEEAAIVDGAGPWYIFFRLILPVSKPVIATVVLFTAVGYWNEFFQGLVLSSDASRYPLQTYIQQMVVNLNGSILSEEEYRQLATMSNQTLNAAKLFIAIIPVLVVYPFLQRYFITGITLGSVKE